MNISSSFAKKSEFLDQNTNILLNNEKEDERLQEKVNEAMKVLLIQEKEYMQIRMELRKKLGIEKKKKKDLQIVNRTVERELNNHNQNLFKKQKTIKNENSETEDTENIINLAQNEFQKIIENHTEILQKSKLSITINDGKGKQTITIPYKKGVYDSISHIHQTCQQEIGMNKNAMFTDEFGNILLPNLDIIDTLFPFYNFQVTGKSPQIQIIHPYGFPKALYYKETKINKDKFSQEDKVFLNEHEDKIKKLKAPFNNVGGQEQNDDSKNQNFLKRNLIEYQKRFGKMWLIIQIIAVYQRIFQPRQKTLERYQFLNSVEQLEAGILQAMKDNKEVNYQQFVDIYFDLLKKSDIYIENRQFKKMAVFQKRYESQECVSYNQITTEFLKKNEKDISCYDPQKLTHKAYGDYSQGFHFKQQKGYEFQIGGRSFQTDNAYYFYLDSKDLDGQSKAFKKKLDSGWVDTNTKYFGIVVNFYDPTFKIMMYYAIFYDFRFGFKELVLLFAFNHLYLEQYQIQCFFIQLQKIYQK